MRAAYGELLAREKTGAALLTATGRVLLDPARIWASEARARIPVGGGALVLPSGAEAYAERIEHDDVYVVRRCRLPSQPSPPRLKLRLLGEDLPLVLLDSVEVHLRPRHVEMLALLVLYRGRMTVDVLCAQLYGENGHPASIRVEMSRLRRLLPGVFESGGYVLCGVIDSDMRRVRGLLQHGAVGDAAAAYPGPLLAGSDAPGIERERAELDGWMRQAAITSNDADVLWDWVRCASGRDDLLAWQRLIVALEYTDARRSLVAAHIAALRRSTEL